MGGTRHWIRGSNGGRKTRQTARSLETISVFSCSRWRPSPQQIISNDISELQKNQSITVAKIAQYKRKLMDLSHRVLQVSTGAHTRAHSEHAGGGDEFCRFGFMK